MQMSAYRQPEYQDIKGHFYSAFDPNTREIQVTVEAASEDEAQHRMATVAHLIGIKKSDKFFLVVLEDAPQGVPTFFKVYFSGANFGANQAVRVSRTEPSHALIAS